MVQIGVHSSAAKSKPRRKSKIFIYSLGWLLIGIVLTGAVVALAPCNISSLSSHPQPVQDYGEALQRIENLQAQQPPDINPECKLELLTHGYKVERAIIMVHGYTNCPHQFRVLGGRFYDLGYNVLLAPLRYHGLADQMTEAHANLTAEDLVQYTDEVVDIAQGLGTKVDIAGISAGGVIAAYAGQYRQDIDQAIIMAPAFGLKQVPPQLTTGLMNLVSVLPNTFVWWDPVHKMVGGIDHAYPRFSTHALGQTLRFGLAVRAGAKSGAPVASKLLVITNAHDPAVNSDLIAGIVQDWRSHGANLTTYEFPASLNLEHDFIEPENPKTPVEVVYPTLIELMSN